MIFSVNFKSKILDIFIIIKLEYLMLARLLQFIFQNISFRSIANML